MNEPGVNGQPPTAEYIDKMVRLVEAKARVAGVSREQYAQGIIQGKYPPIDPCELDSLNEPEADDAE